MYLGKVVEDDKKRQYYIKENLPLLHRDMSGFLDRREQQLKTSLHNKKNYKPGTYGTKDEDQFREEARMEKNRADEQDYKNGQDFITLLKERIRTAGASEKANARLKCAKLLQYDFDKMFIELMRHNAAVKVFEDEVAKNPKISMKDWETRAKKDESAKKVLEILKNIERTTGKPIDDWKNGPKAETPSSWMIKQMKLDAKADRDLIRLFQQIDQQEVNAGMKHGGEKGYQVGRLEALFRVTLGKEVELYGQMMEGGEAKMKESEMAQYNTMITSYIADHYGFSDEIASTKMRFGEFTRWDGTVGSGVITMQEVARGKEWIDVIKDAEKEKQHVRHTHNSIRQLIRLQMNDTLCQQRDRHGRNFKCALSKVGGEYYHKLRHVKSVKAYDHDQSHTPESIAKSFFEERGKDGKLVSSQKNRFLPEPVRVVKKNTAMYYYLSQRYFAKFGVKHARWMEEIQEPKLRWKDRDGQEKSEAMTPFLKSNLLPMMFGHKMFSPEKDDGDYKKAESYRTCIGALNIEKTNLMPRKSVLVSKKFKDLKPYRAEEGYTFREVVNQLKDIIKTLADFYVPAQPDMKKWKGLDGKNKNNQKGVNFGECGYQMPVNPDPAQLKKVAVAMRELNNLNEEYDFSGFLIDGSFLSANMAAVQNDRTKAGTYPFSAQDEYVPNLFQAWIDQTLFQFAQSYGKDPRVKAMMQEDLLAAEYKQLENENGDIEVPTLLHVDKEAYDDIVRLIGDFEDPSGHLRSELKKLHMSEEAIEAEYQRAKDTKARWDYMAGKAQLFLNAMYKDENDPRRHFFLKREEYKLFKQLDEFATDPGNSYLVQDDENYLQSLSRYQEFMTKQEKENALEEKNKVRTDAKRWNADAQDELESAIDMEIAGDEELELDEDISMTAADREEEREQEAERSQAALGRRTEVEKQKGAKRLDKWKEYEEELKQDPLYVKEAEKAEKLIEDALKIPRTLVKMKKELPILERKEDVTLEELGTILRKIGKIGPDKKYEKKDMEWDLGSFLVGYTKAGRHPGRTLIKYAEEEAENANKNFERALKKLDENKPRYYAEDIKTKISVFKEIRLPSFRKGMDTSLTEINKIVKQGKRYYGY